MGNSKSEFEQGLKPDVIKEYNKFIKKYKLCDGNELKVKVNETFGVEFLANYTVPQGYDPEPDEIKKIDEGIELVETKEFDPYPAQFCNGYTQIVNGFKAKKVGIYKIEFTSYTLTVTIA